MNVFDFGDQPVTTIDHEQLRQSVELAAATGKMPKTRPIEHYELLDQITQVLADKGVVYEEKPIHVHQRAARIIKLKDQTFENGTPIDHWHFEKLIIQIALPYPSDKDSNASIAIAYHDKGIDVSFGANIHICDNLTIFTRNRVLSTYGANKVNFEQMMELFNGWASNFNQMREQDIRLIQMFKGYQVLYNEVLSWVGLQMSRAVGHAYNSGNSVLNINQVSSLTREMLRVGILTEEAQQTSLWNVLNACTAILHPENVEFSGYAQVHAELAEQMMKDFAIEDATASAGMMIPALSD